MSQINRYLAFDLGASSCRAILGVLEEDRMKMHEVHRFPTPVIERGERLYWNLNLLRQEIHETVRRIYREYPDLRSVSVDSWGVDYVPLGRGNTPLRDAYCYRDPRVVGLMDKVFETVSAAEIYKATGIQFMEINTIYQVVADRQFEPDLFERTTQRLMMADYINFCLGGQAVAEVSLASTTQLMDPFQQIWASDLMARLGIPDQSWPAIVPSGSIIGQVPNTGVNIIAGCSHDTACAVAAAPANEIDNEWAYLSCGTWSLLGIELQEPSVTESSRQAGFTNEAGLDGTIRFLKNLTGLWVLQECEREWREAGQTFSYQTLLDEATAEASSDLRINLNDPRFSLRGQMQEKLEAYCVDGGLPLPKTRGAWVRTILESLAVSHHRALKELEELMGNAVETLYIVGGGSRNTLLCQLTADACGCKVVAGPAEATALGNLLIQARTMGDFPEGLSIRDIVRTSSDLKTYVPMISRKLT